MTGGFCRTGNKHTKITASSGRLGKQRSVGIGPHAAELCFSLCPKNKWTGHKICFRSYYTIIFPVWTGRQRSKTLLFRLFFDASAAFLPR